MVWAWVLTLAVLGAVLAYYWADIPIEHADSYDYQKAVGQLLRGEPNVLRTPGYGIICGLCGAWWGIGLTASIWVAMVFTAAMWMVATAAVGSIARHLDFGRPAAATCMVVFGCYPAAVRFVWMVLPEALAVCACVFLLYDVMRLFRCPSAGRMAAVGGWILALILLKPVFLILLPMCLLIAAWMAWKRHWSAVTAAVASVALLGGLVWSYTGWWKSHYGFRSYSIVNTVNNYALLREADAIHAEDFTDPEMRAYFSSIETYVQGEELTIFYEMCEGNQERTAQLNQAVNTALARNKTLALRAAGRRFTKVVNMPVVDLLTVSMRKVFAPVKLGFALLLAIAALVMVRRTGRRAWQRETVAAAALLTLALWLTNWFGAQNDWGRLFMPAWGWTVIASAAALRACLRNQGAESDRHRRSKASCRD